MIIYTIVNLLWITGESFARKLQIKEIENINTVENIEIDKTNENIQTFENNNIIELEEIIDEIEIQEIGTISIPSINLIAPIAEDTTEIIMDQYVGHFITTSLWNGNIGLAAHNRRISCKLFSKY